MLKFRIVKVFSKQIAIVSIPMIIIFIFIKVSSVLNALNFMFSSQREIIDIINNNMLNTMLFPFLLTFASVFILQIKIKNNFLDYEKIRLHRNKYFLHYILAVLFVNLVIIFLLNLITYLSSLFIINNFKELHLVAEYVDESILYKIRSKPILYTIFNMLQQWISSSMLVLFSISIALHTKNIFLAVFSSTIYLFVSELLLLTIGKGNLSILVSYMPSVQMLPFPQSILQLEAGVIILFFITMVSYYLLRLRKKP